MNKNEMNSKPRRAQGGKGLLSRSISEQNPQESIPLIPREEREEERKGERGARRRRAALFLRPGKREKREREGEGVRGYLTPTTLNPKD